MKKKRVLGLDLGTNSIGWALVEECQDRTKNNIIKLGVRVVPLTIDEKNNFEKGRSFSINSERTFKRSSRRSLHRFKLRRKKLLEILTSNKFITSNTHLTETGKATTHQLLNLRAISAREKVSLEDLARIFLSINKKRGYKSSRKVQNEEHGQAIDGMLVAKELYDNNLTVGQYVFNRLKNDKRYIPNFYRSDLQQEFDKVWYYQQQFYPEILKEQLHKELQGKNMKQTWAICKVPFNLVGIKIKEQNKELKGADLKKKKYELRSKAIFEQLDLELLAIVLQEINNDLNKSSGYLGEISDRSKALYFNKLTVGEYLWKQIKTNPHTSLKNQVFYRQDYLDEFEQIWETQAQFYTELTNELKEEIRDVIIFYQRKLKSQKGLLSFCQFESWEVDKIDENKNIIINKVTGLPKKQRMGRRVISKSSPLFQEFKIWKNLNDVKFVHKISKEKIDVNKLDSIIRNEIFKELNIRKECKSKEILNIISPHLNLGKLSEWQCNFDKIEGNRTNAALYNMYENIAQNEGYGHDWDKKSASAIQKELEAVFLQIGVNSEVLYFDANFEGKDFDKQLSYQLWHLLYATQEDDKISEVDKQLYGNSLVSLKKKLHQTFGFKPEYAKLLAGISLQQDYGNLSAKAIRKIIPYLQDGHKYSEVKDGTGAIQIAYPKQSKTLFKNNKRPDKLDLIQKNSLRNPVVEKILNQMVNLVNEIIDKYGKFDEIKIELARELKKNTKERAELTRHIENATRNNNKIKEIITKEFKIPNPTKNDVVRYKLYQELEQRGYRTLFSNTYIPRDKLFTKEIEIEHIIPKALLLDDSFSNKTLAYKSVNLKKSKRTAIDFITNDNLSYLESYKKAVEELYDNGKGTISKGKRNKLLMSVKLLPENFLERDLRNTQYIAKKAKDILQILVESPVISTSGKITNKLREDWDLVNVMKELNLPKYKKLGLTEYEQRLNKQTGKLIPHEVIKDWTKRNDHRHHAMDALTVAFTTRNHINYLNNKSASNDKKSDLYGVAEKIIYLEEGKNGRKKRKFISPMNDFRSEAKKHIESILISFKNKNKVVTKNKNYIKGSEKVQETLTPRGQLHKETIYGKSKRLKGKPTKLNKKFTLQLARLIANPVTKSLILKHLEAFDNNPEIAFDSKTIKKNPIIYKDEPLKEVVCYEEIYTIRKPVSSDLKIEKVIDHKVKMILKKRLDEFGGNSKKAFSDLDQYPIWLNKEKQISIKRVTITGVSNTEPLHYKKDHFGREILNNYDEKIPVDFVSTGNNHHVAIYKDEKGKLQEKVVSLFEAVERVNQKLPIIDKEYNNHLGWEFLFTMKQNEMFVFPNDDFDINEINLLDENNTHLISKHLFRVQKISSKDYLFTHHLETKAIGSDDLKHKKMLSKIAYNYIQSTEPLRNIVKVRINHLGEIVYVGEL